MKIKIKLLAYLAFAFALFAPQQAQAAYWYKVFLNTATDSYDTNGAALGNVANSLFFSTPASSEFDTYSSRKHYQLIKGNYQTVYFFAKPADDDCTFVGWSTTNNPKDIFSTDKRYEYRAYGKSTDEDNPTEYWFYAHFKANYYATVSVAATPGAGGGASVWQDDKGASGPSTYKYNGEKDVTQDMTLTSPGATKTVYCYAKPNSGYMHIGWQTDAHLGTATIDRESNNFNTDPNGFSACTYTAVAPSVHGKSALVNYNYYAVFAKQQEKVWLPIGGTKTISNVAAWRLFDWGVATGSLSGSTITLTGRASGTTKVLVYTTSGEWVYYDVEVLPRYYARINLTSEDGDKGKVWVGQNDTKNDAATATSDYSQWETDTAGQGHTFYLVSTPASGYMHWGWLRPDGVRQRHEGTYSDSTYGAKESFNRTAATDMNATNVYNFTALYKRATSASKTLVLNGTKTTTVSGTLDIFNGVTQIGDPTVVSAVQKGGTVEITGLKRGSTTVKVYTDTDYITYTISVQNRYYAKMTTSVVGGETGGGKAYVQNNPTESTTAYTTNSVAGPFNKSSQAASADVGGFYLFAMPDFGYKFTGWSKGSADAKITISEPKPTAAQTVTSSATSAESAAQVDYYAHFSNAGVTVKDVYLAVGDQVQFFFYNATAAQFSLRANSVIPSTTTPASGQYATFKRSVASSAKVQKFNVTIAATAVSGSAYDELTVMDYQGNVYYYRVHVSAARVVKKSRTEIVTTPVTATATSYLSAFWTSTVPSESSAYVSASVSPTTAATAATVTFTGKAASSGPATVQVSNYQDNATTGEQGATYTYAVTVTDPPVYTYYARVATVVVDGASVGVGRGWAYASRRRQEDSDVYQTTRCPSELGSVTYYENVASTNVDGFYIFAFPNMGYKFTGWSVNDPNGEIISTEAFSATDTSISVMASSKTAASPTEMTYYAHFEKDESKVRDITLAVGDSVRLSFYNTTKCNWSLQVVYTNGTEKVVNLDDTAAHAGGYATYTRSASVVPSSVSNEFSMFVQATKVSGNDFDQLTIEDYEGNVYHYRVHVVERRVIEQHEKLVLPANSFAENVWTKSGVNDSLLTVWVQPNGVATNSAKVHVTGVAKCQNSTFTVSNYSAAARTGELGATYTYSASVIVPWQVEFCQGDQVVIYYHNTVAKNWYLLINGNRVEPNVAGKGEQMTVTLSADNPDTDTEILGVATTPGLGDGDLVVVTDGENFYPYRMAVRPRRVLEIGQSKSMTCSTVATSPWRIQVPSASNFYIDTAFSPDENEGHSATVTITGKNPGTGNIVYVANFKRDDASINAQGAYYTLVTDVVGPSTHSVYMSQGTSVTWGEVYPDAADETTYTVTPSEQNLMTAAIASNTANTVFTTLTTPANATPYKKALFTVKDQNNEDVVKYDVMSYTIMSMAVGQVAPGCLTGSPIPWVVVSSNPAKLSAEPTVYNKLNSGRIEAKAPGDFSIWATNAYDQVGWYSIRAQVYDEAERLIAIPVNGVTNVVVRSEAGLESVWSLTKSDEHITATLDNASTPADHVTVTITGGTDEGTHLVQVNNAFHHEKLKVFVGANAGEQVVLAGSITFTALNTVSMPGAAPTADWTAKTSASASGKFTLVNASGAAGEPVQVYGIAPGKGQVIVDAGSTIYVYDVEVAKNDGSLPALTVGVGYSLTTNLTAISSDLAGATLYQAPDSMIANAMVSGNNLILNGVQEGRTTLKLATENYIYTMEVIVHERNITKYITLYTGDNGTTTSYSYTFDKVVSFVNRATDRLDVTQNGETITIAARPGAEGIGGAVVECFVDGLAESSTLNYHVTIIKQASGYKVQQYDEGHVAYKDADVMRELDGDLVFVFTNVQSAGSLIIPEGYSARVDILAVGGGGGGGSAVTGRGGGGGGAGGYTSITNKKLVAGTFGVAIGPGGLGLSSAIGGQQALPGQNGGDSLLTNAFGYVIAAGVGGGGGGAPSALYYSGIAGGSGGGGSWIWDASINDWIPGRGGMGKDGQGCTGGTPTETNCGGGGGGASGNGGGGQARGAGKYSDISGVNTYYALGGEGGRSDKEKQAEAGQGPGFGGDGGNSGPGGNGGDGTVVVRFHRLYQNVLVPIPTTNDLITARFQWADGTNYTPIVYQGLSFRSPSNAHPYNWEDVFETISGITNVVCELGGDGGTNKVGVGYYNFYLKLKDGFAWDDGSEYGSVEKIGYRWVICENWSDIDANINVRKSVTWSDKSNAVIRVSSLASPEMTGGGTPKVLFLGSLCSAHSLARSTIVESLNSITRQANVDYYLYANGTCNKYGSLGIHESITESELGVSLTYSQHSSLRAFYERLYEKLVTDGNTNKYDYIVMEFDGSRIAKYYVDNNDSKSGATIYQKFANEKDVAEALVPFYAKDAVIWIVDNADEKGSNQYPVDEPFGTTNTVYDSNRAWSDLNEYWRPNTYFYSAKHLQLTDTQYQGLIGIFDPKHYIAGDNVTAAQLATTNKTYAPRTSRTATIGDTLYYGNDRNPLQAHYENPELVTNLLASAIKVKPFNLTYKDKIVSPEEGLTIQDVQVSVCTTFDQDGEPSSLDADWKPLMHWLASTGQVVYDDPYHRTGIKGASMGVNTTSNLVTICLSNINFKVWVRYDTHVLDAEGKFQTSDGANYNEQTGQYEKNPNEGAAQVSLVDDVGVGIGVEGDAETEVPWRYTAYRVSGSAKNGSAYVAGTLYSSLSCPEGRDVTVYYRGDGGFRLTAINVDGNSIEVGTGSDNSYTFANLQSEHNVQVVYTAYYGTITPVDASYQYDGVAHVPSVKLEGWDASYATETRYSLTEEGPYYTQAEFEEMYSTNRDVTCVGDHEVYCRVYAYQEGYGATLGESGWVWVDTRVLVKGTVTITPKPLVITANSFRLSAAQAPETALTNWHGVAVRGLVEGDTVNTNDTYLTWDCPTYKREIGQYAVYPKYQSGISAEDVAGTNYIVYLSPGVVSVIKAPMIIGGITQFGELDPDAPVPLTGVDRVEIEYNGAPTNLVIDVQDPTGEEAKNLIYKYSIDDGQTWTRDLPSRLHVGSNKVWYVVEDGDDFDKALFFSVTNYNYLIVNPRAITFAAASATKRYDGTPLVTNGYDITSGSLATGDAVNSISITGTRTNVGTTPNVIGSARIENGAHGVENLDRTSDYEITYIDGTLTVTPGAIQIDHVTYTPGGQTAYGYQYSGVRDVEKIYDGIGTNIDVNVVVPDSDYRILYTTSALNDPDITWRDGLSIVDAGRHPVNFIVKADNYATVTNVAYVIIHPRELTVTINDTFMHKGSYDPEYSAIVTYTDTGDVVPLEVLYQLDLVIGPTNAAYQTTNGDYDLVLLNETVQGNYKLNVVPGTLTVDEKLDIPYEVYAPITTYDGEGHSIEIAVDTDVVTDYEISYSLSPEGPWSDTPPVLTNATTGTRIYYHIVSTDDYRPVTGVALQVIEPHPATVTVNNVEKYYKDADPTYTAVVSGLLAGEEDVGSTFVYDFIREPGEEVGTKTVNAVGETVQGNYSITYVPGTLTISPWLFPVGPLHEKIPIDETWIKNNGGDEKVVNFPTASNYVFTTGTNGQTNWVSYVLGLEPTNLHSVVYLDIEENPLDITKPTLVTRGAKVHAMPLGSLTNVLFRLIKSSSPTGTYERVDDKADGRFPQNNVPAEYFRVNTRFFFNQD